MAAVSAEAGAMGVAEVVIHIDATTLCEGRHADTLCETVDGNPVPVATMQRFCCEAAITTVIVEADGTVRRLTERAATREPGPTPGARRDVLDVCASALHRGVLEVPDPSRRLVRTTAATTVIDNMLPVCEEHHHLVHEGRWNLSMTPDRTVTWTRPDGSTWITHPSINRRPPVAISARR